MKITSIEPQKNKNRVNIYIDNLFTIGIDNELRYKYKLEVDMEVDDYFIQDILKAEEQHKVTNYALNLLSYRQRSEKEIYLALKRKGFDETYINYSINYCIKNNYINDKSFAKSFINDKLNLNKLGPERIKYELILKGISKDIIEELLIIDSDKQYEMAIELAQKKLPSYKKDKPEAIYRKLSALLQRKGYSYDIISRVMRKILKD